MSWLLRGAGVLACRRVRRGRAAVAVSHLLVAADVLSPGYEASVKIAVCGAVIDPGNTPVEVEEDPGYCRKCVRAAVGWNLRRGAR